MNVNCQASQQLFSSNNEKFGNLRLGPQLMKDIKKMLTHPMRNPYDKTAMKTNHIVMQDYRPPFGQLFPNEALLAGPERPPNNIYVPAKQVQITNQNTFNGNDIELAASTPDPRYLPAAFNTIQQSTLRDAEFFQRQRQNGQYVQNNRLQSTQIRQHGSNPSNSNAGQITQTNFNANLQYSRPTQSYNNGNLQYGQKQISNTRPTQVTQLTTNSQRGQFNQQLSHYTNNQSPARLVNGNQNEFSLSYSKQQFSGKQEKQPYTYKQPQLQFSSDINGKAGNEAKQNLALVFSLLADSINVAKYYSNAQHDTIKAAPVQSQFQNINNEELSQITNQISQLTSSQYSINPEGYKSAKLIAATHSTPNNERNQHSGYTQNQYSQKPIQFPQNQQYSSSPSKAANENQSQLSRYRSGSNTNIQTNSKQLYSGQLYQLPVPDVTQQINNENVYATNGGKSPNSEVEIIKSETIPIPPPARLEASPTNEHDRFNSDENFKKFISSNSGISAQLQDKIIGTLPHLLENNKLVTYKKDESYYVYTKLDKKFGNNNGNSIEYNNADRQPNARLIQGNNLPNVVAFQFIPSVSYQLEDEKEQQKLLNAFNIDEYGSPKQKASLIDSNSNQPILTTNVDFSIDHTLPTKQIDRQLDDAGNLYAGPSSYSAPQASVGRLISKQKSNLELEDNTNGYAKIIPTRQFTF